MNIILRAIACGVLLCILSHNVLSQDLGDSDQSDTTKYFKFMPIPYVSYDRSLGFQIGAVPMAMYNLNKKDTISPQSISGLFGMWTTNGSWFGMGFSKFFLNEDRWRIMVAGGAVSVNFQTYVDFPVGGFLDYNTGADFVKFEVQRRTFGDLFVGVHYVLSSFLTSVEGLPEPEERIQHGIGFKLERDGRDDVYYPRKGGQSEIDWTSFPAAWNPELGSVNRIELSHNQFFSVREDTDVVGLRGYVGFGIGTLPFERQFIVGQTDIRGYTQGKYRGNSMYAIQGEYRWNFTDKMSAVGFFGMATVAGSSVEENNGAFLPGLGAGFRYMVFEKNHFNVGLDGAVGRDDWGIYFRIGEAF